MNTLIIIFVSFGVITASDAGKTESIPFYEQITSYFNRRSLKFFFAWFNLLYTVVNLFLALRLKLKGLLSFIVWYINSCKFDQNKFLSFYFSNRIVVIWLLFFWWWGDGGRNPKNVKFGLKLFHNIFWTPPPPLSLAQIASYFSPSLGWTKNR